MKQKLIKIIFKQDGVLNSSKCKKDYFIKYYPEMVEEIESTISDNNIPFNQKLYLCINDLKSVTLCKKCGNNTKFISFKNGYSVFCSSQCANSDKEKIGKGKNTKKEKYGDENYINLEKTKKTKLEKYGDENYNNREKNRQTMKQKYGVEHYLKSEKYKEKNKKRILEQWGVQSNFQIPFIKEKINSNNLKKWGTIFPIQNQEIKNKILKTIREKYGVDNPNQSEAVKEKKKQTVKKKYGHEYVFQIEEVKQKIQETNIKKLGVPFPTQSEAVKDKIKNSQFENYKKEYSKFFEIEPIDSKRVKILNHCPLHPEFVISKNILYQRFFKYKTNICTECYPVEANSSIKEKEVLNFIKALGFEFKENDRTLLNGQEIVILLPQQKLAIEFNGTYFHSDSHKDKYYHYRKNNLIRQQGFKPFFINEVDFDNKKEIVFSMLKNRLGLTERKINARECQVKKIYRLREREFLKENHLFGWSLSNVCLGLFFQDELVALMSFSKKRKNLGQKNLDNHYELLRFVNKVNCIVIGGANKLLKHFEKNYKPSKIITYADKDYSSGEVYFKMGFQKVSETKPGFFWVKNSEKINRFSLRKDLLVKQKLISSSQKAEDYLKTKGYSKIWNSGNFKFIKNYETNN